MFQPTDARRAFPCWDEPALKATFDVTLIVPKDRVALSNMVCLLSEIEVRVEVLRRCDLGFQKSKIFIILIITFDIIS